MLKRLSCLVLLLACRPVPADDEDAIRAANIAFVNQWHAANVAAAESAPHLHILPRVQVDMEARTVSFYAEATGIGARDPIEFFLIGEESGNAYEAVAVALAAPADIDKGIALLGLPKGRGANPAQMQFWPKGERVIMTFDGLRAESFLLDSRTGQPLPTRGLVYTSSQHGRTEDGEPVIAAQVRPPFAIAANYNEPDAILDVPWQAPQTAVYQHQAHNPERLMKGGERILVVMTPEYADGRRRVQDLRLMLSQAEDSRPGLAGARFSLDNRTAGVILLENAAIDRLTATFADLVTNGQDPFVEVHISDNVPLKTAREVATVLRTIDSENGIRIEPPPPGTLFYQAFTPNEAFRDRADRYMQPWELHLDQAGAAVLTRIDEHWKRGEPKPDITTEDIPVAHAQALVAVLTTQNTDVRGIYVFAPPALTVGRMMEQLRPALSTHPHVHVYLHRP